MELELDSPEATGVIPSPPCSLPVRKREQSEVKCAGRQAGAGDGRREG